MKLKSKIQKELDKSWEIYNSSIDKFVESKCEDVEVFKTALRVYGRIEALHWVLNNDDVELRGCNE